MKKFNEWLKERSNLEEGSLGLQRRNRVAAGMAKRAARAAQIFSPSDSYGHEVTDQLHKDVQATAGRFDQADYQMRDRSKARIQRIARGDKQGRLLQAGRGNLDQVRANMDASRDANAALANYNNPNVLSKRGVDPNWAADGKNIHTFAQSPIGQASRSLLQAQRDRDAEIRRDVAQGLSAHGGPESLAQSNLRNRQDNLDRTMNPKR